MSTSKKINPASGANNSRRDQNSRFPILVMIGGGGLLLITLALLLGYFLLVPRETLPRPVVFIHTPENGSSVNLGEQVLIHATARDQSRIVRMEFWLDGELLEVERSEIADGTSPFPSLVDWEPAELGEHTITFRAFNSRGGRAHASIQVEAGIGNDRDLDGTADEEDACPDQAGALENDGCPLEGDIDGDGILDEEDYCPEDPGLADVEGCPDRDGDGIPDGDDADPDRAGPASTDGAPDRDGDGVADREDLSPEEAGDPAGGGAPDSGVGDRDGDGAADDLDPCPDDPGSAADGYCPPPAEDPPAEEDGPGGGGGGDPFNEAEPINIEVEAFSFQVNQAYDHVWCYLQLADGAVERYDFEPEGEDSWDIARVLSNENSVRLVGDSRQPLSIQLECRGALEDSGDGSSELVDLGSFSADHDPAEWDGRELVATGIGPDEAYFRAGYRVCSPTCDESIVQPPILAPVTMGPRGEGPYEIRWRWDGDPDWLIGFSMMVNGTSYDYLTVLPPGDFRLDLEDFQPSCGETLAFQVTALGRIPGSDQVLRSPPSNLQVWDGESCPRTVLVSFLALDGYGVGGRVGPISGTMIANDQILLADYRDAPPSFDATDDTKIYLDTGLDYNLASLFAAIEREASSCLGAGCTSNYAPAGNYLEVELGPNQSLTFGGRIWDEGDGLAFEEYQTLSPGEIVPGVYPITGNGITLTVGLDVIVGPEAGGEERLPDLTITDLTMNDAGQLVVHVFNNAADLLNEDINIALIQISSGEQIDYLTWEDVTIPAGGDRQLVSPSAATEPYDLRLLLDPVDESGEDGIRETNELNNIYETPVEMAVQINSFRIRNGPCESFLSPGLRAEFYFRISVSHRSPDGEITVVGTRRYPWSGVLEMDWTDSPWEHIGDWDPRDDDLMRFEFEMPADHTLMVHADGYEDDSGLAADDYAGRVDQVYGPEVNYGHSPDEYHFASEGWHDCPDGTPLGWDTNNFHIWWNITRVH